MIKKLFLFFIFCFVVTISARSQSNSQPLSPFSILNAGFETGSFTNWNLQIGDNSISSYGSLQNISNYTSTSVNAPLSDSSQRFSIMTTASGNDPNGVFPIVPAGLGNYTARMGEMYAHDQGEILTQTWVVTANQPYIKINYAVVASDAGHLPGENPYFTYTVDDSASNVIATRYDDVSSSPPGYSAGSNNTFYLPWQSDSVSLVNYIGQTIFVRFTVAGCINGDHYAYCYIDLFDPTMLAGVSEINTSGFSLFPNPGNTLFNIQLDKNSTGKEQIRITDLLGNVISVAATKTEQGWQIDMSGKDSGIYFISVTTASGVSTQRLIVK